MYKSSVSNESPIIMRLKKLLFCFILTPFLAFLSLHAHTHESNNTPDETNTKEEEEPPEIGNFSLPVTQQPAGLYAFGGNIINKGQVQFYFFADGFIGKRKTVIDLIPSVLFGITDEFSIYVNFPYTPCFKEDRYISKGLQDLFVQLEYAFYVKSTSIYVDQATILGNISYPTGSIYKNPATGFGAPSLFLGATYYRSYVDWTLFTCQGAILTTTDHRIKVGDMFFYQFGIGKNICTPPGMIYAWMLELDGQYNMKNKIHGKLDPNSGGNFIVVTPSLMVSSENYVFQFGVSFPINQYLYGKQNKFDYILNLNLAWTLY